MRILGVDIGTVRTGFAVSDPLCLTAQPLRTREVTGVKSTCTAIVEEITAYEDGAVNGRIGTIVLGHPLHLDGRASEMSARVEECARRVKIYMQQSLDREIPVELWNERLTSVAAERALLEGDVSRKDRRMARDRVAAQLLLHSYLEAHRDTIDRT